MAAREQLVGELLDLLWRHWTTLGVAGIEGAGSTAIDLEALLLLTAQLAPEDPRLRDEALDWCASWHRFIAKPRLKQLVKPASEAATRSFASFSSTLQHHVGGTWPSAERTKPWKLQLSHKSRPPDLEQPALISLKSRALFGVSARADVITAILKWPAPDFGAADLVFVGYTKRNLADALDALALGGLLRSSRAGNRVRFSWRKRAELRRLLGPLPQSIPRWPPIFRVLGGWLELLERVDGKSERLSVIEAVKEFTRRRSDMTAAGVTPPRATTTPLEWSFIAEWMLTNVRELTQGRHGTCEAT